MSEKFTGNKEKWWVQDFQERFCSLPFEHALVLNCGNGWVEREFIDKGMTKRITAFDYSTELLKSAQMQKENRPITYFRADVNTVDFPPDQFDLVINVAALHHVQYINRICHKLCKAMTEHGIFVHNDYIGPHRNQYSIRQWFHIKRVNRTLPPGIRKQNLRWPHLPTMLAVDPTEAIHSELIIDMVERYFDIFERHDTGGGIAYEILTHNEKLDDIHPEELYPHIERILNFDRRYTEADKVPPLFSYFISKPKKDVLLDETKIRQYQLLEDMREMKAENRGGVYSFTDFLGLKVHAIQVWLKHNRYLRFLRRRQI